MTLGYHLMVFGMRLPRALVLNLMSYEEENKYCSMLMLIDMTLEP